MAADAVKNPALFEPADSVYRMFFAPSSAGLGISRYF
jgi:hypothetical protein